MTRQVNALRKVINKYVDFFIHLKYFSACPNKKKIHSKSSISSCHSFCPNLRPEVWGEGPKARAQPLVTHGKPRPEAPDPEAPRAGGPSPPARLPDPRAGAGALPQATCVFPATVCRTRHSNALHSTLDFNVFPAPSAPHTCTYRHRSDLEDSRKTDSEACRGTHAGCEWWALDLGFTPITTSSPPWPHARELFFSF